MKLGERIRARRQALGLTQEQLAQKLGVSAPAVNKWERNLNYPDITLLPALARTLGVDLNTLAWTLSMGTDIGGSATPIGASANVAGTAIAAREGHPISWGRYCKYSAPAAVIVVAISMAVILLRY